MNPAHSDSFPTVSDIADQDLDYLTDLRDKIAKPTLGVTIAESDAIRRLYVRVFITQIESTVARIKNDVLQGDAKITAAERAILSDVTFDLNDKGEPYERQLHPPLLSSIRFAFRIFGKTNGLAFQPDYTKGGWQDMQAVLRIRNRLTHPKNVEQMKVSNQDLRMVDAAELWFRNTYRGFLEEHKSALQIQLDNGRGADA
jgi:hypothetical protein